jgi:hypothetical protein
MFETQTFESSAQLAATVAVVDSEWPLDQASLDGALGLQSESRNSIGSIRKRMTRIAFFDRSQLLDFGNPLKRRF